jgi:ATP/ADP translocase
LDRQLATDYRFMPKAVYERLRMILPACSLGLLTAAFIVAKTGRDALFFQGKGIFQLPVATMTITAASLPLAIIFVKAMKTWGARPARIGVMLFGASVLMLCAPFLEAGDSTLLFNIFIFIPSIFGIMFASLWLLASDLFENTAKPLAARLFSRIAASSLGGGIAGGFIAKALVPLLEPRWLIFLGALMILGVAGLVSAAHRRFPSNIVPNTLPAAKKSAGYLAPLANRYALTLMFIAMTGALAGLLIDVQFYISASSASMGSKGNANFFANFYIMLNFSSLLLQLFAAPRIQDRIGIRGGLMVLPFALIGGASFASAAATAFSLSVLRVTEGGLRSSIHRSIWEQAFIPVDSGERSVVKLAVDGIGARIAEGLAAAGLYVWVQRVAPGGVATKPLDTTWMAWVTLATVVTWLLITRKLHVREKSDGAEAQIDCERFPDQCPCTTELGKGIA